MATLFVSDLHLSPERPGINEAFFRFVERTASTAEALYVLGDLFEYWAGDDDDDPFHASILAALRTLGNRGVALYLMHGNRDFLIGERFATACRARLLPEPALVTLYGTPTLLMHGDTLCTEDVSYQEFRRKVRDPAYQRQFLSQPLASRKRIIAGLRAENAGEKELKTEAIMDVTTAAVEAELRAYGYPRLIHGHTHRPARHLHIVDGHPCERWVLNDWYERGGYLRCDSHGCTAVNI